MGRYFYLYTNFFTSFIYKKLLYKKKNLSGKSSLGYYVSYTKGSKKKNLYPILILYVPYVNLIACILNFFFFSIIKKSVSLIIFSNGAWAFMLVNSFFKLFNFFLTINFFWFSSKLGNFYLYTILYLPRLAKICQVEHKINIASKYIISRGSQGLLIEKNLRFLYALVELPSKKNIYISIFCFALLGCILPIEKNLFNRVSAGYYINHGLKPSVRGIAMNAVDHPHGGRTKSIRYPRTPWGKTTKFKN